MAWVLTGLVLFAVDCWVLLDWQHRPGVTSADWYPVLERIYFGMHVANAWPHWPGSPFLSTSSMPWVARRFAKQADEVIVKLGVLRRNLRLSAQPIEGELLIKT